MNKRFKDSLKVVAFGVVLLVALNNLDIIASAVLRATEILQPIIIGAVIAFILNVPVTKFSELFGKLFAKMHKNPKKAF